MLKSYSVCCRRGRKKKKMMHLRCRNMRFFTQVGRLFSFHRVDVRVSVDLNNKSVCVIECCCSYMMCVCLNKWHNKWHFPLLPILHPRTCIRHVATRRTFQSSVLPFPFSWTVAGAVPLHFNNTPDSRQNTEHRQVMTQKAQRQRRNQIWLLIPATIDWLLHWKATLPLLMHCNTISF